VIVPAAAVAVGVVLFCVTVTVIAEEQPLAALATVTV